MDIPNIGKQYFLSGHLRKRQFGKRYKWKNVLLQEKENCLREQRHLHFNKKGNVI